MIDRPPPRRRTGSPIDTRTDPVDAAQRLLDGETLWIRDHFRTGLDVIGALVRAHRPPDDAPHDAKQAWRTLYREVAWRLLAPVEDGRVALRGGPVVGFLPELYPDGGRFWLPFPEIRDLQRAWALYDRGVPMAVLGHPLHPFYGTYLPKRTLHLELFATWLSRWQGPRDRALDVGTGSGVLALMLARTGFAEVVATDSNPNACESVRREIARRPEPPPVRVHQTDLLDGVDGPADLVVFNPPWTPGPVDTLLDRALNYEGDLFPRFFDHVDRVLSPEGRLVLVFSDVLRLVRPDDPHPVDAELAAGRFRLVERMTRRVKPKPGPDGRRRTTKERVEVWEIARAREDAPSAHPPRRERHHAGLHGEQDRP